MVHITVCVSAVEVHGRALQHVHGHCHCSLESLSWPLVGVVSLIFSASEHTKRFLLAWRWAAGVAVGVVLAAWGSQVEAILVDFHHPIWDLFILDYF